jgi:hypothetical protein
MTYQEILHRWASGDLGLAPVPPYFEVKAFEVLHELNGRRGYRQNWDLIDEEIQEEIFRSIVQILETREPKLDYGYRNTPGA